MRVLGLYWSRAFSLVCEVALNNQVRTFCPKIGMGKHDFVNLLRSILVLPDASEVAAGPTLRPTWLLPFWIGFQPVLDESPFEKTNLSGLTLSAGATHAYKPVTKRWHMCRWVAMSCHV